VEQLREQPLVGPLDTADEPDGTECGIEALHRALPVRHRGATQAQIHAAVRAGFGLALPTARHPLPAGMVSRRVEPQQQLNVVVAAIAGRPTSRAADAFLRLARARDWNA